MAANGFGAAEGGASHLRERWVIDTFVEFTDLLVADFDLADLLFLLSTRCVDLLEAADAGVLIGGGDGELHVVASSSEEMHSLELLEIERAEGPCMQVYTSHRAILNEPVEDDARWPRFADRARAVGFQMVHAFPLRHQDDVVGVLNIFDHHATPLSECDVRITQALGDIVTFAIIKNRELHHATNVGGQLQHALNSRIAIEQAKGILSERLQIDMGHAFAALRQYSRNHNERIADTARRVVARSLAADEVMTGTGAHGSEMASATAPADAGRSRR